MNHSLQTPILKTQKRLRHTGIPDVSFKKTNSHYMLYFLSKTTRKVEKRFHSKPSFSATDKSRKMKNHHYLLPVSPIV